MWCAAVDALGPAPSLAILEARQQFRHLERWSLSPEALAMPVHEVEAEQMKQIREIEFIDVPFRPFLERLRLIVGPTGTSDGRAFIPWTRSWLYRSGPSPTRCNGESPKLPSPRSRRGHGSGPIVGYLKGRSKCSLAPPWQVAVPREERLLIGSVRGMLLPRNYHTIEWVIHMPKLALKPGKVYRTSALKRHDSNPTRLVNRLVARGKLRRLQKGLYYAPKLSVFGEVPPSEGELLRGYFHNKPYLRTGPSVWNALGLGTTGVEAVPLVYNQTRTGKVKLGDREFEFRRVRFPKAAPVEFFVVDLFENAERAGLDVEVARRSLRHGLESGRFDPDRLLKMAQRFGTRATQQTISRVVDSLVTAGS